MILFSWFLWHINHCGLFDAKSSLYIDIKYIWFGLAWFYGISTIVGYFMPNPLYTYILNIYDFVWLVFMAYQPFRINKCQILFIHIHWIYIKKCSLLQVLQQLLYRLQFRISLWSLIGDSTVVHTHTHTHTHTYIYIYIYNVSNHLFLNYTEHTPLLMRGSHVQPWKSRIKVV